ncbi:Epidermal growth factor receptor kinase substrate 8-like protein 3 [Varanus komodoensis]|nr:Epidermal growth factor receptor kinase substrate 8-like protein 3 [Varanus komodoensis]
MIRLSCSRKNKNPNECARYARLTTKQATLKHNRRRYALVKKVLKGKQFANVEEEKQKTAEGWLAGGKIETLGPGQESSGQYRVKGQTASFSSKIQVVATNQARVRDQEQVSGQDMVMDKARVANQEDKQRCSETGSDFSRANSMSRPSGKSIYQQRKEYTENIIKQENDLQHPVEHLLTCIIDGREISNTKNCIDRLKMMSAEGHVWGQSMFLQVKDFQLLLTDIETETELESYPLPCILECACVLNSCVYNSILAITVKDVKLPRNKILLFQCENIGADMLKIKLEKIIEEQRNEQQNDHLLRNNLENMLSQQKWNNNPRWMPQDQRAAGPFPPPPPTQMPQQRLQRQPWTSRPAPPGNNIEAERPPGQQWGDSEPSVMKLETERNAEILNHVLDDIERLVSKLNSASGSSSVNKKKWNWKMKKSQNGLPSKDKLEDCFQKIKYGINLLGKLEGKIEQPSVPQLIHLLFSTLSTILSKCSGTYVASSVVSPLLIPEAIDMLRRTLNYDEQLTWKSLGIAWSVPRSQYPGGESVPSYMPIFSDGWVLPMPTWRLAHSEMVPNGTKDFLDSESQHPQLLQAIYDFHARNPKELTVMKGDLLEILDKKKKWWLARNTAGMEGYIPNNILETVDPRTIKGNNTQQVSSGFPDLQPSSTPAEVTAWLRTKGFSKM